MPQLKKISSEIYSFALKGLFIFMHKIDPKLPQGISVKTKSLTPIARVLK